jgi:hypothetical protein
VKAGVCAVTPCEKSLLRERRALGTAFSPREVRQNNAFAFFCQKSFAGHSPKMPYLSPQMNGA